MFLPLVPLGCIVSGKSLLLDIFFIKRSSLFKGVIVIEGK